jgi:GeoRSP system SPASM domain protein
VQHLRKFHIAASLTISASALGPSTTDLFTDSKVRTIFIEIGSIDELRSSIEEIKKHESVNLPIGIYFRVNRGNYRDLPDLLSLCIAHGVVYLVLPMQRLIKDRDCFYISRNEREELARDLDRIDKPEGMRLVINDPFLWKAFYPEVQYPEGGCQAANSMIYVSPEGDVYPCPAMPVRLGNLMVTPLEEILLSSKKTEIRKNIVHPAERCLDCDALKQCMGGCKGRVYALRGSFNEPDPACR